MLKTLVIKRVIQRFVRVSCVLGVMSLMLSVSAEDQAHDDSHADHHATHVEEKLSVVESLSPELREVLSKEMQALQDGMKSIIPEYIAGKWNEVETIATQMKNSYILKKKLSEHQVHELHSKLPPLFIELDQEFHYLAGMLAHAAEKKKPELVGFYFSKLGESCVGCHTRFATHKFPALAKGNATATATEEHKH